MSITSFLPCVDSVHVVQILSNSARVTKLKSVTLSPINEGYRRLGTFNQGSELFSM